VDALRRHRDPGRIDLLGHSAGTRVAAAYAASHPDTLHRLCLVTPPSLWLVDAADDRETLIENRRGEPWFDAYEQARPAIENAATLAEYLAVAPLAAPLGYARWDERARAHEPLGKLYEDAATAFFSTPMDRGLATGLADVHAPVLVVAGAQDAITGLAPVLAMADLFPAGRCVVLEDAGHFPWVEQPTAFRRTVDEFFTTEPS
jgi:pimeloyl-ACP methyl ester carboxylesterase